LAEAAVAVAFQAGAGDLAGEERVEDGDMNAAEFLNLIDEAAVLAAVREAEQLSSGEVRVFVSRRRLRGHAAHERACAEFHRLDMDNTDDRNAVLLYVLPRDRAFAVIGDEAVHRKCGQRFWDETAKILEGEFAEGRFTGGLVAGIRRAGSLLAEHFPRRGDDRDELPDVLVRD
jgi:uncharacterized membrane protein